MFPQRTRHGIALSIAYAISHKLDETLQRPFAIWLRQSDWQLVANSRADHAEASGGSKLLNQLLSNHERPLAIRTYPLNTSRDYLLTVPVHADQEGTLLVAGKVADHSPELVCALAEAYLNSLQRDQQLDQAAAHNEECIYHITANFEELSWLRSLPAHLELSEDRNDLFALTESTLPSLRKIVNGEAIFFFSAEPLEPAEQNTATPPGRSQVGRLLFADGERLPEETLVREAIAEAERNQPRRPTVWNAPRYQSTALRNLVVVPVCKENHHSGWLAVVNKSLETDLGTLEAHYDDWDRNLFEFGTAEAGLLNTMAMIIATHGRNIELFRDREELLLGAMRALINAIDAKDAYTCGHSDRVASMSRRIASQLGFSALECERIHVTGLLHDIGKIGIPDSILGKPGKLTDEEFAMVKQHPVIGYEILKPVQRLGYVLPGVLHHHEAVNGSGYPHGLKGEKIPLDARIIAIADSYDAMTSNRPYREGMRTEVAERIIREGLGKQWDPTVGEAFFGAITDIRAICNTGSTHPAAAHPAPCSTPSQVLEPAEAVC